MKKIGLMFLMILMIFSTTVHANSIDSITMDIYIDKYGNAEITEVWECYTNQGTESYHPYYNLGESEIKNLRVSDEDGNIYRTLSSWNTNGTLNSKKNKCGLNFISDGVEICWGISEYGSKTYTVQYEITNFVIELNDSQMTYWTLIPHNFSNRIENVEITIHADDRFEDTLDVWGYGDYGALAYVYDGEIKMHSNKSINSDEYMVVLVKFPSNTFNAKVKENKNFNYYYNLAEDGAVHYVEKDNYTSEYNGVGVNSFPFKDTLILMFIVSSFIPVFVFVFIILLAFRFSKKVYISKEQETLIDNATYYRDIPCEKDIFKIFYLTNATKIAKNKTDFMGAVILKWMKNGYVKLDKIETGGIFSKEESCIILNHNNVHNIKNFFEKELYKLMYDASVDGVLEKKELEKWCKNKYNQILSWFDKAIIDTREDLIKLGEITLEKRGKFLKRNCYILSDNLIQEAVNIAGLKKYLEEYTLIHEREPIEVKLFEDYLIFAQIVGIADKVAKDFKDLYPEMIETSSFSSYDDIIFIRTVTNKGISAAQTAKSRAESYSSGGGGFSSGGGGGGSFGGGSGGGGFR